MSYVSLHNHSHFSFLQGVPSVEQLTSHAAAEGVTTLGLTDINSTAGLIRFIEACEEYGIKPVLGVELQNLENPEERLVLIAKSNTGYGDLCELTTIHLREEHRGRPIDQHISRAFPDLYFWTPCPDLFIRLTNTPVYPNLIGMLINQNKKSRNRSKLIAKYALLHNTPLMVSNDVYFLHRDEYPIQCIMRAIHFNTTLSQLAKEQHASPSSWFKPPDKMQRLFPNHVDALEHTSEIASKCQYNLKQKKWILPEIYVPEEHTPDTYLEQEALKGLEENYGDTKDFEKASEIQHKELRIIKKAKYSSYFLMVHQIREWANEYYTEGYRGKKECTIMRGSAANCMTFYNLGASDLDPVRYNLYFERFLNEDRASPPDADLDFGWDERDKVIDYFFETWGEDRVAALCNIHHFRWKSAFREVAKVYGYSEDQVTQLYNQIQQYRNNPDVQNQIFDDPILSEIKKYATQLKGKPHFFGQHCGGLIVTNEPIWRYTGLQKSGGQKNRTITQLDMHNGIDYLGLIKFDILGNGSLSVLRDSLEQLQEQGYDDPEVSNLEMCYNDPKVMQLIKDGNTRGIFYLESPAQSRLNKKAQVETFEEVGISSSLVRPAGTAYAYEFIKRHRSHKQGVKDWDYIHPVLESVLKDTHDICVFQEDVVRLCVEIAKMSFAEADRVRKMMNSLHEGEVKDYHRVAERFMQGCMKYSGLNREQSEELWQRVNSFRGFSFCQSHSLSYAQLSFRCAYLKVYYPAQFLASVISNRHGYYEHTVYLEEAKRWGLSILPIDINQSNYKYYGNKKWIRAGFMHIKNINPHSIDGIVNERKRKGPYIGFYNFLERNPHLGKSLIESLILVGCFDSLKVSRPQLLASLYTYSKEKYSSLALNFTDQLTRETSQEFFPDFTHSQKCFYEQSLTGYMFQDNLLNILKVHPAARNAVVARDVPLHHKEHIRVIGEPIAQRMHTVMKTQKPMMFLSLQDYTGVTDIVIWPRQYERFKELIHLAYPMEVEGIVQEEFDTFTLELRNVKILDWHPAQIDFQLSQISKKNGAIEHFIQSNKAAG